MLILPAAVAVVLVLVLWAAVAYFRRRRAHRPAEMGEALTRAPGDLGPRSPVVFCNGCGRREDRMDAWFCRACGRVLDTHVRR